LAPAARATDAHAVTTSRAAAAAAAEHLDAAMPLPAQTTAFITPTPNDAGQKHPTGL
jgi:hypothetical protein